MIFNMYKPRGWTSFEMVKKVRMITKEKKVGHAGTLDPFAEGVLILGTGKDTKQLAEISSSKKKYRAVIKLGIQTDSLDIEGRITSEKEIPNLSVDKINSVLQSFLGDQLQTPPMFSAKKVNGTRLYKLARQNIEIKRDPCKIHINSIDLIGYNSPLITFQVTCSKGTYIRVLGSDISEKLGTVGHLIELTRLSVGEYVVNDALHIEEFQEKWKS
ncbi:MAG: tRNA pseudouridine(55) synthase TruB [Fidelibacterota bacterium]